MEPALLALPDSGLLARFLGSNNRVRLICYRPLNAFLWPPEFNENGGVLHSLHSNSEKQSTERFSFGTHALIQLGAMINTKRLMRLRSMLHARKSNEIC